MTSKKLTISAPESMVQFLDENPSLSPSKIFQSSIDNIQNSLKHNPQLIEAEKRLGIEKKKLLKAQELIQDMVKFIEAQNLWEKYIKNSSVSVV